MDKQIKKAYVFFDLDYGASEQDIELAALNKTQKIQQKYATNTEKINSNLEKLNKYKNLIINDIKSGNKIKAKEPRFEVSLNSIFTLVGILFFAILLCIMSFYLIA